MKLPVANDAALRTLLERCAASDESALVAIHKLLARRIHAFAFQRLRNSADAETIVFETLYEVWKNAARYRSESQAHVWILGIARFKCLQFLDRSQPHHDDIDELAESLASDLDDGETRLSRWQQAQQVRDCMDELSDVHRECLHLVYFEELPVADVASIQQVPVGTVKTRLFHARQNMRVCVESGTQPAVASARRIST
ncbi:MAG: RNA polymerase sigma factor [Leptothrix sp. (in: b-proteobacteria)]